MFNFKTYEKYLKSRVWRSRRIAYSKMVPRECCICSTKKNHIDCHHKTYENIGQEKDKDLCWLCRPHHIEVHSLIKSNTIKQNNKIIRQLKITGFPLDANTKGRIGQVLAEIKRVQDDVSLSKSSKSVKRRINKLKKKVRKLKKDAIPVLPAPTNIAVNKRKWLQESAPKKKIVHKKAPEKLDAGVYVVKRDENGYTYIDI
jgi:hypothetical protein